MTTTAFSSTSTAWRKAIPLLILAGLYAYCDSFDKAFVLDDLAWIAGKYDLSDSAAYLKVMANRPLIALSILLNYRLGGLNVAGYHTVNLAIHILAALTLFGVVRRTLLLERWQGRFARSAPWLALTVALWWVVHPLTTQAVTYVIQRCESMMGLFYLLALYCAIRGHGSPRRRWWYAAAVASAVCSTAAKEVSATIPLVILVYDWTFLTGSFRRIVKERWSLYAGMTLTWAANALWQFLGNHAAADMGAGFAFTGISPAQYLFTEAQVIPYYLRLCFWPWPLCIMYRAWPIAHSLREVLLPGSFVLVLLLLTGWAVVRRWWPGFLGAWFFLILAPTSSFMPIVDVAYEHRMYLPLIAVLALTVFAGHTLLRKVSARFRIPKKRRVALAAALMAGVALVLGALTFRRNLDYSSEATLWGDAMRRYPGHFVRMCFGRALANQGQPDEGLPLLLQTAEVGNDYLLDFFIGQIYEQRGDWERANRYFTLALQKRSEHGSSHNDLGVTLYHQGKPREAAEHLRKAVEIEPQVSLSHRNLAVVLDSLDQHAEADLEYRRALQLDPGFPVNVNRAARELLLGEARYPDAERREALFLAIMANRATNQNKPEMLDTLAMAYAANDRFTDAVATAEKGLAIARQTDNAMWLSVFPGRLKNYQEQRFSLR